MSIISNAKLTYNFFGIVFENGVILKELNDGNGDNMLQQSITVILNAMNTINIYGVIEYITNKDQFILLTSDVEIICSITHNIES